MNCLQKSHVCANEAVNISAEWILPSIASGIIIHAAKEIGNSIVYLQAHIVICLQGTNINSQWSMNE